MRNLILTMMIAGGALAGLTQHANAENFKTPKECVAGKRVVDGLGKTGTIVGLRDGTMCDVMVDGKKTAYLFWMLRLEGASAETNDKLTPGVYECFAGGRYTFMDMYITGPNTYQSAGRNGRFHVEASRKIVFETGPLAGYNSKLLAGPTIGLNADGGSFYATTCELNKSKRMGRQ